MKRVTCVLAALLFAVTADRALAQSTTTVQFVVLDDTGAPLPDVAVKLEYKGHVVQRYRGKTDKKGRFTYVQVYVGPYTVNLSKEGFGEAVVESFPITEKGQFEKPTEFRLKRRAPAVAGGAAPGAGTGLDQARAVALAAEIERALKLVEAGQYDEAEAAYQKLVTETPNVGEVHYNLGFLYKRKGDREKAAACFRRAIECAPKLVEAHNALAVLLLESGDAAGGLQALEQGVQANDGSALLHNSLALVYAREGQRDRARPHFEKALALEPADPEPHYQLASIALAENLIPEAISRLESYLAAAPAEAQNVAIARALLAKLKPAKP